MAKQKAAPYKAEHYCYSIEWSEVDRVYIGRVAEFASLAAHGDTPEAALREIQKVVKLVLQDLAESNEFIPEPFSTRRYSGKLNLRMPEYLHRQLSIEAARQGVSLNQLIVSKAESRL